MDYSLINSYYTFVEVMPFFHFKVQVRPPIYRAWFSCGSIHKPDRFKTEPNWPSQSWCLKLYRTSRPVRKSTKFSKSGLSGNRMFSFLDAGLLMLLKEKKIYFEFLTSNLCPQTILRESITCTWHVKCSHKFKCPVLSDQETHMPSLAKP